MAQKASYICGDAAHQECLINQPDNRPVVVEPKAMDHEGQTAQYRDPVVPADAGLRFLQVHNLIV